MKLDAGSSSRLIVSRPHIRASSLDYRASLRASTPANELRSHRRSPIALTLGQKASRVKLLILDVDGVLTGGDIVLGSGGMELKSFNTRDGLGITMAREAGLEVAIITARVSEAVELRASELGIKDFLQGRLEKVEAYEHLLEKYSLTDEQAAFVGDDLPDMPVMMRVGLKVAVANASQELKAVADYVTLTSGGHGAVREVVDLVMGWREKEEPIEERKDKLPGQGQH